MNNQPHRRGILILASIAVLFFLPVSPLLSDQITTFAGNGTTRSTGEGRFASEVGLNRPIGIAFDSHDHFFIANSGSHQVFQIDSGTNLVSAIAGNGEAGFNGPRPGSEMPATQVRVTPAYVAADSRGLLYISDPLNNLVRRLDRTTGNLITFAGNSTWDDSGDGGPATSAGLNYPSGVAVDSQGNLFIADTRHNRIRMVAHETGIITTVAGNGAGEFSGDGGAATGARLNQPMGIALDSHDNLFVADNANNRVRRIDHTTHVITTVAGNGSPMATGDGEQRAVEAPIQPLNVVFDKNDNLYIADAGNNRVRKVDSNGMLTTVVGTGSTLFSGDGDVATAAGLDGPTGLAVNGKNELYVSDTSHQRIRKIILSPRFTSPLTAAATVGQPFSYHLTAAGSQPIDYVARQLPQGLSFTYNRETDTSGLISGTPTEVGTVTIEMHAVNDALDRYAGLVLTSSAPSGTGASGASGDTVGGSGEVGTDGQSTTGDSGSNSIRVVPADGKSGGCSLIREVE